MKTYEELWNDISFVKERVQQQEIYLLKLAIGYHRYSDERYNELNESASFVLRKFQEQLKRLENENKIKETSSG